MKFVCSNCKAKYQIADEKAAGRTLRMTCRRCNNEIVIQGAAPGGTGARRDPRLERSAPPPAASSALAADFRRQVAAGGSELASALVSDEWHVAINDIPVGPMRREEVARKIAIGAVTPDSLAWREGLDDWVPAADIPELAMLFGSQLQAPPPPAEVRPAARGRVVPVGGRVGVEASPAVIEDIVIPEAPVERMSSPGTVSAHPAPPPPSDGQNAGRLFLMVSAGVFLMFAGVVVGVKYLTPAQPPPVVQTVTVPGDGKGDSKPSVDEQAQEDEENVIALDMQEIDGETSGGRTKTKTGTDATKKPVGANGKALTPEEQALLAQFSGGGATASLKTRNTNLGERPTGTGEGLSASQLSSVVNNKRTELKRCYESALRATASDETVRMDVAVTIGASGSVTKVTTSGKGLPGMDTCIARTVRMWRFPAAGDQTQTSFPVVFQPGA